MCKALNCGNCGAGLTVKLAFNNTYKCTFCGTINQVDPVIVSQKNQTQNPQMNQTAQAIVAGAVVLGTFALLYSKRTERKYNRRKR